MEKLDTFGEGTEIKTCFVGLLFPLGSVSLITVGLEFIFLSFIIMGFFAEPSKNIFAFTSRLSESDKNIFLKIFIFSFVFMFFQIFVRVMISRRRIIVERNSILVKNIFIITEIMFDDITKITIQNDYYSFSRNLILVYENKKKIQINGLGIKMQNMSLLAKYMHDRIYK